MLCILLALSAASASIAAHDDRPLAPFAPIASTERSGRVHVDVDAEGAIWVRGDTYKARFDASGVTYIPFLGSAAPRNWPVTFRFVAARSGGVDLELRESVAPAIEGERVVVDRGPIDEVWILRPDSIEQTFVVEERHAAGLELVVDVDSELDGRSSGGAFEFTGPSGGVRYSEAFVVGSGSRRAIPSRYEGGSIRIEVPSSEFAAVPLPLIVDPVITTFGADTTPSDDFNADIAWDRDTQRAFVVMEQVFSAVDHDVYSVLLDATGGLISGAYIDSSDEDWRGPSCANLPHADQFCVVASVGNYPGSTYEAICARTTSSASLTYQPKFLVAIGAEYSLIAADIGADTTHSSLARYCVVMTLDDGVNRHTGWRMVSRTGDLGTWWYRPFAATNSRAVISNMSHSQDWTIAYMTGTPGSVNVYAWTLDLNGFELVAPSQISLGAADITQLSVSAPLHDGSRLIGWRVSDGSDEDIALTYVGSTLNILGRRDLAQLEESGAEAEDQRELALACDGDGFVAVYAESVGGSSTNFDVKLSNIHVLNAQLGVTEAHLGVSPSLSPDRRPQITSAYNTAGQSEFFAFVWDRQPLLSATRDIYAGSYVVPPGGPIEAYCFGDMSGPACPCGNVGAAGRGCPNSVQSAGALLTSTGVADRSSDTLVLQASHMPASTSCLFFQGTLATAGGGSHFGDGLRCASGSVVRLATKAASAGGASYPGPGDTSVSVRGGVAASGARRYYQAWYRNAASFCTASTFNLTNGLEVVWLP